MILFIWNWMENFLIWKRIRGHFPSTWILSNFPSIRQSSPALPVSIKTAKRDWTTFSFSFNSNVPKLFLLFPTQKMIRGRIIERLTKKIYWWSWKAKSLTLSNTDHVMSGNYSVYGFEIRLSRSLGSFILSIYLPSAMFVMMSWVSFFVPPVRIRWPGLDII